MTLRNAFENVATDSSVQATNTKIDQLHADTQAVSNAIIALGAGALFTDAHGQAMSGKLDALATEATLLTLNNKVATDAKVEAVRALLAGGIAVDASGHTQPISVASLPLPTGAATDAKLEAVRALLAGTLTVDNSSIISALTGAATETTLGVLTNNYAAIIARTSTALNGQVASSPAAVGAMGFDGTNYRRLLTDAAGVVQVKQGALVTQPGDAAAQIGASSGGYAWNGSTWDRIRSAEAAQGTTGLGLQGVGVLGFDGTNWQRLKVSPTRNAVVIEGVSGGASVTTFPASVTPGADGVTSVSGTDSAIKLYNGTNLDRLRSVEAAQGTAGTGLLGVGNLAYNGTNWVRMLTDAGSNLYVRIANFPIPNADAQTNLNGGTAQYISNGTNFDRVRSAESAQNTAGVGLLGAGNLAYDATNSLWRRMNADSLGNLWTRLVPTAPLADASTTTSASVAPQLFNGSTYDRLRAGPNIGDGGTGYGIAGALGMGFNGSTWDRLRSSTTQTGRLLVQNMWEADTKASGTAASVTTAVTLALPQGANQIAVYLTGTWVATVNWEASFDGGTTYLPISLGAGHTTQQVATTTGSTNTWWEGAVPAGTTHVRVRTSAYTSGTVNVTVAAGQGAYEPAPTVSVSGTVTSQAAASTNRMGFFATSGIWFDDSTATLAAAGTFTGTARDLINVTSNTAFNSAASYPREFRAIAISDVVGSLYLEVSRDSTTWRRVSQVDAATTGTGGLYVAQMYYKPVTRYARLVYINGAGAQTHFTLQTVLIAG